MFDKKQITDGGASGKNDFSEDSSFQDRKTLLMDADELTIIFRQMELQLKALNARKIG